MNFPASPILAGIITWMDEETGGHEQDPHRAAETLCHKNEIFGNGGTHAGRITGYVMSRIDIFPFNSRYSSSVAYTGRIFGSSNGDLT